MRVNWIANADDTNPHAAFRPRDKEKMKLRRNHRPNDDESRDRLRSLKDEAK